MDSQGSPGILVLGVVLRDEVNWKPKVLKGSRSLRVWGSRIPSDCVFGEGVLDLLAIRRLRWDMGFAP